jgi:hypothetical protein
VIAAAAMGARRHARSDMPEKAGRGRRDWVTAI